MPERAEVEAVARIVRDELPYAVKHSTATRIAERAIAALARSRALDRVRDARGDDERGRDHVCYVENGRCQYPGCFRSPQSEDHEALMRKVDERRSDPEFMARVDRITREEADVLAALASPSRDGTVAVEDVAEWLRVRAGRTHGNGASSALYAAARDLRAEFGPARAGESNEGGNQNDERRH